jgi:imidazolonepropionase-like protein
MSAQKRLQHKPFVRCCASFQEVSMRRLIAGFGALLVLIWIGGPRVAPRTSAQSAADLVLRNGKVLTVDARDSVAQAVAIAGGKIVAVGTEEEVRSNRQRDADIALWNRDLYTVPADALKDLTCEMTLFRGKIVYEKGT